MVKTKFKKAVSLMLAAVMSLTAFTGIGATTAFAAVGEKADVYLVDYPRSGDTNNNGEWGHGNLNYMNGWKGLSTKYTGLRAMGSYSGNIAYCIEPGTGQRTGDTLTEKDENFFNNISPNGTISGDDIRLLIGRILQYGYRGGISTSWKSQNESDANCIAHAYATQILIWETIVGERDAGFNHVSTSGSRICRKRGVKKMTWWITDTSIGQRLKFVRRFRRLTQKELGLLMGYSEKTADVRIAQYEKNARTPNAETTAKLAEVLKVSPVVFSPTICASREDLLQSMYWLFLMKGGGDIYDCETEYARSRMEQKLGVITVEEFLEKILVN